MVARGKRRERGIGFSSIQKGLKDPRIVGREKKSGNPGFLG